MYARSLLLSMALCISLALSLLFEYPGNGQDRPNGGPTPVALALQPGATADHPDGAASPILYQGTESVLVTFAAPKGKKGGGAGWDLPEGFSVQDFALSQDGQRVWLLLFNGDAKLKGKNWQLWSLRTDGSDRKELSFLRPEKAVNQPILRTNGDGTIAWVYTQMHEPFWETYYVHLQQIQLGGAARTIADTKGVKGITNGSDPQVTADGKSLFYLAREGIVQVRDTGVVQLVQSKKDITYQGASLEGSYMANLVLNADGSHWAVTSRLSGPKSASLIVVGTPNGIRLHADTTPTVTLWGVFTGVRISQDGATVLMEREVAKDGHHLYLWHGDQVKPVPADVGEVYNGILAGNGQALYAVCGSHNSNPNQLSGFLEKLPAGKRHMAMTGALSVFQRGNHQLNRDGTVLAAPAPFSYFSSSHGLYVFREGPALAAHPQIKSVRQRYDGSKLILSVEAGATDGLGKVFLLALKNGYLQAAHCFKKPDDNPLGAFGVNFRDLTPDAKRPGVYQLVVDLGQAKAPLDNSYSLRIVAANEAVNRTTFVDVPLLRVREAASGAAGGAFPTFAAYLKKLDQAKFEDYKGRPGIKVANATEFNKMKAHLQSLYRGVKVTHTFIGPGGRAIDCVAIDQQPGALAELQRGRKLQLVPPAFPGMPKPGAGAQRPVTAQGMSRHLRKGSKDKFGKEMHCPEGSIPMLRVTLGDTTRFATIKDFLQKHHGGSRFPPAKANAPKRPQALKPQFFPGDPSEHRYAHAYQGVANYGGSSWLNLWIVTPTLHQFSLSQQWYAGGDPIQTVEGGWQVYPDFYGHNYPVLFVYWTADGYNNSGAYNLTSPGFIQVNNSFVLGLYWDGYSSDGGGQYGFRMTWYRDPANGNWWLYLQGRGDPVAIGYYPQALYGSGQLSQFATQVDFGGEVTGQTATGQMGSGAFASAGWQHAAYQRDIFFFPTSGQSAWADLFPNATHPAYYTIDVHNAAATDSNWGTHFFFGGPGGR